MKLKFYVLCAALLTAATVHAQEFLWDLKLDARFDNREYKSEINWPQTLFGSRLTPQIGIGWNKYNYIKVGTDLMADFGAPPFNTNPDWIAYYGYETSKFSAFAGVFPRDKMIGRYNSAFFSDSVRFYDTNLEGMLLQYRSKNGWAEFGCDWSSMLGEDRREKFMLFGSGEYQTRLFDFGGNASMYHHAGTIEEDGVVDNILLNPYISFKFRELLPLDEGYLRGGWLQAFQNDRKYVGEYVKPGGAFIEAQVSKWNFGIYNALYLGDDLMPYYAEYPGNDLYFGEPWFRTELGVYNRLEFYWNPIHKHDMDLYVASVHHYDGAKWGWQQVVQFTVKIDQGMFSKQKHKRKH